MLAVWVITISARRHTTPPQPPLTTITRQYTTLFIYSTALLKPKYTIVISFIKAIEEIIALLDWRCSGRSSRSTGRRITMIVLTAGHGSANNSL